jgi:cytochrome c-type biogenesis protein CcmH
MSPSWTVSLFWAAAAACVVVALAFVLPALLRARGGSDKAARRDVNIAVYRDQLKELDADRANGLLADAQYQRARQELEARLAEDALVPEAAPAPGAGSSRKLGFTLAAVLPAAAFGLYAWLGYPAALTAGTAAPDAAIAGADFSELIRRAEEKARANPGDGEAWVLLARSYAFMERWPEALAAFEKASGLLPQEASLLTGHAEALAAANNRVLAGRPMELVRQGLALDPDDTKGLELAGIFAYQQQDFAQAAAYLARLHKQLPADSAYAQDVLALQQEAERLAGPGTAVAAAQQPGDQAAPGAVIRGRIDIAPALRAGLNASDVLFLFARAGQGGPPVAAIRATAGQLPLAFELDDSTAMNPGNRLSQHKQVTLVARVSRSGEPMAQPGDLEGTIASVAVGASGVELVIDRTRP